MASSAVGYAGFIAAMAIVGLLAAEITGSDLLAGLPAAAGTIGTAAAATPLALRAKRLGRRPALTFGYQIAIAGTVLVIVAGQLQWFWLLVAAMPMFGVANASNLQARFAAADLADDETRARSIAMVVWVGPSAPSSAPPAPLGSTGSGSASVWGSGLARCSSPWSGSPSPPRSLPGIFVPTRSGSPGVSIPLPPSRTRCVGCTAPGVPSGPGRWPVSP